MEFETRQKNIAGGACIGIPPAPAALGPGSRTTVDDRLESMNEIAILGFACGLSNVMGVSSGCGFGHSAPEITRVHLGTPFEAEGSMKYHGHDPKHWEAMEYIYEYHSKQIARMIEAWSKIKEGDRTVWDNTVIVLTSDNGEHHHSNKQRWPVVVIGNAGGKLKADGRYIRYARGAHALADLFSSIGVAAGAQTPKFGEGGREQVKGPIPGLMA
jgi:hypothetical protein